MVAMMWRRIDSRLRQEETLVVSMMTSSGGGLWLSARKTVTVTAE